MNEIKESTNWFDPPRTGRSRPWLRGLLLLVIWISGAVVGAGGALIVARQRVLHRIHHPEEMPAAVVSRLQSKLGLNDRQAEQVETVLENGQREIQAVRRQFQPRLEDELDQLGEEIGAVLDRDQRRRWDDYFLRLRKTWLPTVP
jgi:hypothetical protein